MSGSLNKVMLIGNLGTMKNSHHLKMVGALVDYFNKRVLCQQDNGEKVSSTEWHNIVVKNKAAEICEIFKKH